MKLDDPTDNNGLGWRLLSRGDLEHNLCIWLKLIPRWKRRDYNDRIPMKSDEAARQMAEEIAERLKHYPIFESARLPKHVGMGSNPPGHDPSAD